MPEAIDIDFTKRLCVSGFTLEEISIFYDFDSQEAFVKELESRTNKPHQVFISQLQGAVKFTSNEISQHKQQIINVTKDPVRLDRLLIKKITEFAATLGTAKLIVKAVGMTLEELDFLIIKYALAESFGEFVERHHSEAKLQIGKELFNKAVKDKDSKALMFMGEKMIEEMKPEKQNIQINMDNRKVVILPAAPSLKEIMERQNDLKSFGEITDISVTE